MLHRAPMSVRRGGVLTGSLGALLVAALLSGTPALAAPGDWPSGDWASVCVDADATYCIAEATVTPVGGAPTSMAELGLTASAATVPDESTTWMRWSVDGWAGQPAAVTGGEITLAIRTGSFVPRLTAAVAAGLRVSRSVDDAGRYTLTVTGTATHVDWTTGEFAAECVARQYCGDYDTMADDAGTGFRFEGRTQDLEGNAQNFIDVLDGAYFSTDAQAHTDTLSYDTEDADPYLWLGVLGNPQLDVHGDPVRSFATAWLPGGYFTATGITAEAAMTTGFDVVAASDGLTASLPVVASASDGGVRLDLPDIGVGAAIGELKVFHRPSGAAPGDTAPGPAHHVTVTGGQDSVLVGWQTPEVDGGAPVNGYRARAFSAAAGGTVVSRCDADADATSCQIWNLTDGETYHIAVSAITALGEGRAASRVEATAGEPMPDLPSEPRSVHLVPGVHRLAVSWIAPASDGGDPVGSYTVRAYRLGAGGAPIATCETQVPSHMCTLTGLTSGAKLYVGVTARNMMGAGPESVRASATVWTVASTPRGVTAASARSRITVRWLVVAATGGTPVTGYRAELYTAARGGSAAVRCTASAAARSCVTGTLKPGRTYYATVTALNAVGGSAQPTRVKVLVRR
jgi:hypothetical protein